MRDVQREPTFEHFNILEDFQKFHSSFASVIDCGVRKDFVLEA